LCWKGGSLRKAVGAKIVALALASAGKMVLNSSDDEICCRVHGCRWIAAAAITRGSIASLAAPCKVQAIKVP
jgi:hypothetical protein